MTDAPPTASFKAAAEHFLSKIYSYGVEFW